MISVIIPVYNTEQSLGQCIDSVLKSTYKDFELILVNDGSTDNSLAICRSYCEKDKRIWMINQENRGVSEARNRAIDASRGDWIVFVDSDDMISSKFLEMVAEEDTVDLLLFDFIKLGHEAKRKESIVFTPYEDKKKVLICKAIEGHQLSGDGNTNMRSPCGKAYRRSVIDKYSIRFIPGVLMGEDILFNIEFILRANSCKYITVPVYLYTVRMGSVMHGFVSGLLQNYLIFQKELKDALVRHGVFFEVENTYYANALENMAYVLIKEIFSPYNKKTYSEKRMLCKKMAEDEIYTRALKDNYNTGILARRILLCFFRHKCYYAVKIICNISHFFLERTDRKNAVSAAGKQFTIS